MYIYVYRSRFSDKFLIPKFPKPEWRHSECERLLNRHINPIYSFQARLPDLHFRRWSKHAKYLTRRRLVCDSLCCELPSYRLWLYLFIFARSYPLPPPPSHCRLWMKNVICSLWRFVSGILGRRVPETVHFSKGFLTGSFVSTKVVKPKNLLLRRSKCCKIEIRRCDGGYKYR